MIFKQVDRWTEWITLNIVNGLYLIKDWILLNVGAGITSKVIKQESMIDEVIGWGIGLSIIAFNVVRIVKYVREMKRKKDGSKV